MEDATGFIDLGSIFRTMLHQVAKTKLTMEGDSDALIVTGSVLIAANPRPCPVTRVWQETITLPQQCTLLLDGRCPETKSVQRHSTQHTTASHSGPFSTSHVSLHTYWGLPSIDATGLRRTRRRRRISLAVCSHGLAIPAALLEIERQSGGSVTPSSPRVMRNNDI